MRSTDYLGPCGKRVYRSVQRARQAHARKPFRVRVYWCRQCHGYHVTNNEKQLGSAAQ